MSSIRNLQKPPVTGKSKAQDTFDELDDPKVDIMRKVYAKPLDFRVVYTRVMVRQTPSTKGELIKALPKGSEVAGYLQGSWLYVPGDRPGWILTDGTNLGLGRLLEHNLLQMSVQYCFSNAVLVSWGKIPARVVEYSVEWHTREDPEKVTTSNRRETNTVARVQGLPHETEIRLRIIAHILTDAREYGGDVFASLTGEWCEAETDREITDLEEENLCCDPLANIRGRCMDCDCDGFVMSNYGGNRPDSRLESIACRRCACSCTRHVIIGEFSFRGPRNAPTPVAKSQPKLINLDAAAEVRKQAIEPVAEMTWKPEDAHQGDKVQFVLDKVAQARTLYETLGLRSAADDKDVRSAYRQASLIIHPDKVRGRGEADLAEQAEAAFKIITSAYEILGDETKRMMYDRSLNKYRPTSTINGSRSSLNGLSFIRRFLSKAGFGYDLNAKPKGDWEQTGPGQWRRSTKANIVVTHAISGDTYEASLEKGSRVLALKKRMVKDLKRGPESRIELAGVDGSDRPNNYCLSGSETLILVGIDLGPPKDVKVCLCHADTGARVRVTVPDTSSIEEVREAAALKLNRDVNQIWLGFRSPNKNNMEGFQAFEDTEYLNGREQILLMGVDVIPMFTVEEALELQDELIIAYGADWFQEKLDGLLGEYPPLEGLLNPEFKTSWGELVKEAQRDTMVKHGFDGPRGVYSMLHAFTNVGGHPDVRQKVEEIDKKLRVTVGAVLPPVIPISIEQAVELDLSIVVDRMLADWPIRLKVRQGISVKALKERLVADESTEGISASEFGLCMFSREHEGPVKQLNEMLELTVSHRSLCICDKSEPMLELPAAQPSVARSVSVVVFSWSNVGDVRQALAKKIGADAEKITIVSETDSSEDYVAHLDLDEVGLRRRFKVLGVEIPDKLEVPKPSKRNLVVKGEPLIQEVSHEGQQESKQTPEPETAKADSSTSALPTPSSVASSKSPASEERRGAAEAPEKRKAEDGNFYTRQEFIEFYGPMEGPRHWLIADRRGQQKIQEKLKEPKETAPIKDAKPPPTKVEVQPPRSQDPKRPDFKHEEKPTVERRMSSPDEATKQLAGTAVMPSTPLTNPEASDSKTEDMMLSAKTALDEPPTFEKPPLVTEKPALAEPAALGTTEKFAVSQPLTKALHLDKPVSVNVKAKHVSTGAIVTLQIMSNSTMLNVKREIARRIGRPEVLEFGKIVQEVNGFYESFPEGELLGLREELLFMNASLEENPSRLDIDEQEYRDAELRKNGQVPPKPKEKAPANQDIIVRVTAIQSGITVAIKIDKFSATAGQVKEVLATDIGRPDVMEGKVLRRNNDDGGYSSFKDDESVAGRLQLHFMGPDITPIKGSPADKRIRAEMRARTNPKARAKAPAALPEPEEPLGAPELVLITISHATNSKQAPVEVAVMNNLTILRVKEALAKRLRREEVMTKGRFVQKKGMSSFSAVRDTEVIGSRKALLFMGMDLK